LSNILSKELASACHTLFGPDISLSPDFLSYLQLSGLKTAFRKKAMESHPDRSNFLDAAGRDLHAEFLSTRYAYELLYNHLYEKVKPCQNKKNYDSGAKKEPVNKASYEKQKNADTVKQKHNWNASTSFCSSDFNYAGRIPTRTLLFGEFLYYSGVISWKTLIDAITWQRIKRPRLGKIAMDKGFLSCGEVLEILNARSKKEKFGEFALKNGLITAGQLKQLLEVQQNLHVQIGSYFINHEILTVRDLFGFLVKHKAHNQRVAMNKKRS
jgi:hypothetical protein